MRKNQHFIVDHPDKLCHLMLWPLPFFRPKRDFVIQSPELASNKISEWENQLRERLADCGCEWAGMGFTFGTLGYLLWIGVGPVKLSEISLNHLWHGMVSALGGLMIGKIWGYFRAHRHLTRMIRHIQQEWKNQESSPSVNLS